MMDADCNLTTLLKRYRRDLERMDENMKPSWQEMALLAAIILIGIFAIAAQWETMLKIAAV